MKLLCLLALVTTLADGESHPSWWLYTSPEATALVGIHWDNLRGSPFAPAVEEELSSTGTLGFPDLECLRNAREIVISSPALLAAEAGNFPAAIVKNQAQRAGLRHVIYRGVSLWAPQNGASLGVAQISEQLLLVGARRTLESTIDQSMLETGRSYSALLPRAARFSQTGDLWVVAAALPDPLASLFVPLEDAATGFAGQLSIRGGLAMEASFDAGSNEAAAKAAADLRDQVSSLPPVAQTLDAESDGSKVTIELHIGQDDLHAALHAHAPAPVVPAPAPPLAANMPSVAAPPAAPPEFKPNPPETAAAALPPPKPAEPQVIRIIGLDGGPREIVLPASPETKSQ